MENEVKLDTSHEISPPEEKLLEKPKRKLNWKLFFIAFIVVLVIEFIALRFLNTEEDVKLIQSIVPADYSKQKSACEANKGKWIDGFRECENGIDDTLCKSMSGIYNACDSPCRNDTGNNACIELCVRTCKFK